MKIKSLLVMPEKKVQTVKIPASIKFIRSLIGDKLVRMKLDENTIIIADKNAKQDEFNRMLGKKVVFGTFLIVGIKNNKRVSLKKRQLRKYVNMFKLSKHEKRIEECKKEFVIEYLKKLTQTELNNNELQEAIKKVA